MDGGIRRRGRNAGCRARRALQILGQGPTWNDRDVAAFFTPFAFPSTDPSDLGLDMLVAFYIAYHHGGDLLVHRRPLPARDLSCCCR